jgi:lipopolysaccharide/colanic/teichoic acid biosynthesis glycosyltransferase
VRPGITGLWQVAGDHRRPIHHQIAYDLLYLRRASPALDLWICVQTVAIALGSDRLARTLKRTCRKRR